MDANQTYILPGNENELRAMNTKDLLADAIESADILKSVCNVAELDAIFSDLQSIPETTTTLAQTGIHSPALPYQEASLPFSVERKLPLYSKPVSMTDPRMLGMDLPEFEDIGNNEDDDDDDEDEDEADNENDRDDQRRNEAVGVEKEEGSGNNNGSGDGGGADDDDDNDDDGNEENSSSSDSSSDSSTDDDDDTAAADNEEESNRKVYTDDGDSMMNTDDVIAELPSSLCNIDSGGGAGLEEIQKRASKRSNKIEIISVVEQRMSNRPDVDMKIVKPRTIPTVKIPEPRPMFRKPVACKLDKTGQPMYLELPEIRRYNSKAEASTYAALGERAYPNDLVIGISDLWRVLVSRPGFQKYAYIKQRVAISSYGTILRTLSENLESCTYVHKVTNNISSDLSHYTLVYGAVPLDMINCTLDVLSYILSEYHASRMRNESGPLKEPEQEEEDPKYAPVKDGEIELLIFNYWQLSTQDLMHWNDQTPRLNLKRLLMYVWSLLPESKIKANILKLAVFNDTRNRISAECMWYIKTNFIGILTLAPKDKAYINAWNFFMKQSRVHHYACFHTIIEMHLRVRNVALSLRKKTIELADAECPGNMLTLSESQRIMHPWVGRPTPSASRELCLSLNNTIFWAVQELTMYLVRHSHYPRYKLIDLGHMQGFLSSMHERVPIHEISLVETISDPVSLRKIRAMLILQLSAYSPLQIQPKITDDAFTLFMQFVRMTINYAVLPATYAGPSRVVGSTGGEAEEEEEDADTAMMHRIKCTLNDFLEARTTEGRKYDTWASTSYDNPKTDKDYKPTEEEENETSDEDAEYEDSEYSDKSDTSDVSDSENENENVEATKRCRIARRRSTEVKELNRLRNVDYAPSPTPLQVRKFHIPPKPGRDCEDGCCDADNDALDPRVTKRKRARSAKARRVRETTSRVPDRPRNKQPDDFDETCEPPPESSLQQQQRPTPKRPRSSLSSRSKSAQQKSKASSNATATTTATTTPVLKLYRMSEKRVSRTKCVLCDNMSTIRTVEFIPNELSVVVCAMCVEHIARNEDTFDVTTLRRRVDAKLRLPLMFKVVDGNTRVALSDDEIANKRIRLSYNRFERDLVTPPTSNGKKKKTAAKVADNVATAGDVAVERDDHPDQCTTNSRIEGANDEGMRVDVNDENTPLNNDQIA